MTKDGFNIILENYIKEGMVLKNPGKGFSTIKSIKDGKIKYQRGNSFIYVGISDIHNAYLEFRGKSCSTKDLKNYKPNVFDSSRRGHSCNCTFLFKLLEKMKMVEEIKGKGVRGEPFNCNIK